MIGWRHAPATLPPGKKAGTHYRLTLLGPRADIGGNREQKISCPQRCSNTGPSSPQRLGLQDGHCQFRDVPYYVVQQLNLPRNELITCSIVTFKSSSRVTQQWAIYGELLQPTTEPMAKVSHYRRCTRMFAVEGRHEFGKNGNPGHTRLYTIMPASVSVVFVPSHTRLQHLHTMRTAHCQVGKPSFIMLGESLH
jgi:hypothetical protein